MCDFLNFDILVMYLIKLAYLRFYCRYLINFFIETRFLAQKIWWKKLIFEKCDVYLILTEHLTNTEICKFLCRQVSTKQSNEQGCNHVLGFRNMVCLEVTDLWNLVHCNSSRLEQIQQITSASAKSFQPTGRCSVYEDTYYKISANVAPSTQAHLRTTLFITLATCTAIPRNKEV